MSRRVTIASTWLDIARPLGPLLANRAQPSAPGVFHWRSADGASRRSLRGAPPLRGGSSVQASDDSTVRDVLSTTRAAVGSPIPNHSYGSLLTSTLARHPGFTGLGGLFGGLHVRSIYPSVENVKPLLSTIVDI